MLIDTASSAPYDLRGSVVVYVVMLCRGKTSSTGLGLDYSLQSLQ